MYWEVPTCINGNSPLLLFAVQVYYCLVVQEISVFSDLRGLQDSEEEKKRVRFYR